MGAVPMDAAALTDLLPELDDAPGPELTGGGSADGLRFPGPELTGDATGARFLECVLTGCDLAGVPFDRARLATCLLAELRSPAWSLVDATLLDVVLAGGRFGALTAHGAELTRVALEGVKVDFADLRGARLVDVTLTGCTVGELDLTGAELRDVRLVDCSVGSLVLSGSRNRAVDLRGAEIGLLDGVPGLRGCTISTAQLTGWAGGMAAELGVAVG
ncbi:pentapeptide repeat-containing protein [Modestobacter versicolor]|uniref:pentapeptide repeat-containing protein n=1 Tax=Modestobacter versicolor TaxID=429133 RepID=UPI0034DFBC6C